MHHFEWLKCGKYATSTRDTRHRIIGILILCECMCVFVVSVAFFFYLFVCFNPFLLVYVTVYALHLCIIRLHTRSLAMLRRYSFLILGTESERARVCVRHKVNAPRQHLIKCRSICAAAFHLFIVKNRVTRAHNIIMYRQHTHRSYTQTRTQQNGTSSSVQMKRTHTAWCLVVCSSLCEKELGCTREWMFNGF